MQRVAYITILLALTGAILAAPEQELLTDTIVAETTNVIDDPQIQSLVKDILTNHPDQVMEATISDGPAQTLPLSEAVKAAADQPDGVEEVFESATKIFTGLKNGQLSDPNTTAYTIVCPNTTKSYKEQAEMMIDQIAYAFDANGDAFISRREFYNAYQQMQEKSKECLKDTKAKAARDLLKLATKKFEDSAQQGFQLDSLTEHINDLGQGGEELAQVEDSLEDAQAQLHELVQRIARMNKQARDNWHKQDHPQFKGFTRAQLLQFAKDNKLFSDMDLVLWGMKHGVDPQQMRRVVRSAVGGTEKTQEFNTELELWSYESGAAFEPSPLFEGNAPMQQELIQSRHAIHDGRRTAATANTRMQLLERQLAKYKDLEIQPLSPEEQQEVDQILAELHAQADAVQTMVRPLKESMEQVSAEESSARAQGDGKCCDAHHANNPAAPWADKNGHGCDWYAEGARCRKLGSLEMYADSAGFEADEACCVCGGGAKCPTAPKSASRRLQGGHVQNIFRRRAPYVDPCQNEMDTFSCKPRNVGCTEEHRGKTQAAIDGCASELGRTQTGVTAVGDVTQYFTKIAKMLEDCSKRTSRRKKCKGIKPTVSTLTDVITKVANYLAAVPIVGKIAKAVKYGFKILDKAVTILSKVFNGLKKIDTVVQKAKSAVDSAKAKADLLNTRSDQYYKGFSYVYGCKAGTCSAKSAIEAAVYAPMKFHEVAYTVTKGCRDTLKRLNDGPLKLWIAISGFITSLMSVLDPIFDLVEQIFDLVNGFVSAIAQAFNTIKCCMPAPIQWAANAVTSVVNLAFCPIDGVLKSLSNQLGGVIKNALVGLASKLVPNIKFTIGAWSAQTQLTTNLPPVCNNGQFSINWNVGWAGWSIDTTQIDNAAGEVPSFNSFCSNMANEVAQGCRDALNQFNKVLDTCSCPIPVIGPIINVINCFPADATVVTPQGEKPMSQLKVGDCVLSKRADGTEEQCDEVYMFGHAEHSEQYL